MTESLGRAVLALETDASGLQRGLGQSEQRTNQWLGRISQSFNRLASRGPEDLARSLGRATASADEAFRAVEKLDRANLDTAKARKYAETLDSISIEAQQTLADLRALQTVDPHFDTPELRAAADQLDRVGREASESARSLNDIKGVGASTEFERLANEAREASTHIGMAGDRTDGLMGKLKGVRGVLIGLGLALSAQQLVSFAADSSQAFQDLERAGKSVDQIFGSAGDTIDSWADRSADAAGLSRREVKDSAAVQGQALINMGYDAQAAADEIVKLQQRGADLAATFGGTTAEALQAVGSLLRGERDPIEKFGVSIKQVDVNARVAALGLDTSTDAAKRNAEAIASLDLFYQQTAGNAGRFAASQDDVTVRLQMAQAKIDDGMAEFGRNVASIQLGAVKVTEFSADELDKFSTHFGDRAQTIIRLASAAGVSFGEMQDRIFDSMDLTGLSFPEVTATFSVEGINVSAQVEEEYMAAAQAAGAGVAAMARQMQLGGPVVAAEAGKIAGMLPSEIQARVDEIRQAGLDSVVAFADSLLDNRQVLVDAALGLADDIENGLTTAETIAAATGADVVAALQEGLASDDNGIRLMTEGRLSFIISELNKLGPAGYAAGLALMQQLGIGMRSAAPVGVRYARDAAGMITNVFPQSEPKDSLSPFRGITTWGGNIVRLIADDMRATLGVGHSAALDVANALTPALHAPSFAMASGGRVPTVGTGGGSGQTIYQWILNTSGVQKVFNRPEDLIQELVDMGAFSEGRLP